MGVFLRAAVCGSHVPERAIGRGPLDAAPGRGSRSAIPAVIALAKHKLRCGSRR
jgi:hypothetical protein